LREGENGTPVKAVCAKHNISEATFYVWRKKYGGMNESEARRMRVLEDENARPTLLTIRKAKSRQRLSSIKRV